MQCDKVRWSRHELPYIQNSDKGGSKNSREVNTLPLVPPSRMKPRLCQSSLLDPLCRAGHVYVVSLAIEFRKGLHALYMYC